MGANRAVFFDHLQGWGCTLCVTLLIAAGASGCAGMVANLAAGPLSGEGGVFASDDDPELVREAVPFGLKAIEALLEGAPENPKLLLAAAQGFAQYAWAFVLPDADELEPTQPAAARQKRARGKRLLARAVAYGMRGLESRHAGFCAKFAADRAGALDEMELDDVPLVFWTGASLGALASISMDDMAALGKAPEIEALMGRALELDEGFDGGAIHELLMVYDGARSPAMGGNLERAKKHFDRARELSKGKKIGPLVSWAENVAVQKQDRALFNRLLAEALAYNADDEPRYRLANLIAQRRARFLAGRAADLFIEE